MGSTHLSLHVHVIFATKDRVPAIAPEWRSRLHAFLGGAARELGGVAEAVGGTADHVHMLLGLKATHCLSEVMRQVKRGSSEWIHATVGLPQFAWQEGYGAFSVSASNRETVRAYIERQEEHHRHCSFREEYLKFLRKHGVAFDERYLD